MTGDHSTSAIVALIVRRWLDGSGRARREMCVLWYSLTLVVVVQKLASFHLCVIRCFVALALALLRSQFCYIHHSAFSIQHSSFIITAVTRMLTARHPGFGHTC